MVEKYTNYQDLKDKSGLKGIELTQFLLKELQNRK